MNSKLSSTTNESISFILPTFNEGAVIEQTIRALLQLQLPLPLEVIVVDDNSSDGTAATARQLQDPRVKVFVREHERGFGSALLYGSKVSSGSYIVWTMADGCDDLSIVPAMIEKLVSGADLVVASRNMPGGKRGNQALLKSICSLSFCFLVRFLFRLGIWDATNAYRAFRREIIEHISLDANDFSISPQMVLRAKKAGFSLAEVPVSYHERETGSTKFRLFRTGRSYVRVLFQELFC